MRMRRRSFALSFIAAAAALALLAAGCGGGGTPGVAGSPSSTTAATTAQNGALAFARCMRSHGLPNWPDPTSNGVFDKSKLRLTGYSVSQVRAAEDGPCNHLLPNGGNSKRYTITAADRADYLKAAACMRSLMSRISFDMSLCQSSATTASGASRRRCVTSIGVGAGVESS